MAQAVLVTRPQPQAREWVDALRAAGFDAQALPLIEIAPAADPQALRACLSDLPRLDAVMFVSAAAAQALFGAASPDWQWPTHVRAWATGPGTARALSAAGVPPESVDTPSTQSTRFDSEALWNGVAAQVRPGWQVLVVRGADAQGEETGRAWLSDRLGEHGAQVRSVAAYRRVRPEWTDRDRALAQQGAAAGAWWLLSSSEAVRNLRALAPTLPLHRARALCSHPRIAQSAREAGFGVVHEAVMLDRVIAFLQSVA